jgi:hypothetical protein
MELKAKQAFSWAHQGTQVEHFEKGQIIETEDQDLIDVATQEGWASKVGGKGKSKDEAPADAGNDGQAEAADSAADGAADGATGDADASTAAADPAAE